MAKSNKVKAPATKAQKTPQVKALPGVTPLGIKPGTAKIVNKAKPTAPSAKTETKKPLSKTDAAEKQSRTLREMFKASRKPEPAAVPYVQSKLAPHKDRPDLHTLGKASATAAVAGSAVSKASGATKARALYNDGQKITVLKKENPHAEGSNRAKAFAKACGAKTVGDYLASGHKGKYLAKWVKSGHLKIA